MNWRDYEKAVFEILRTRFRTDGIEADVMVQGRFSKIQRQIDVAGRSSLMGRPMLAIVDCKCYSSRVDVKDVETVIGMAADVSADIALIVTTAGYSEAALARAHNEPNVRIHLDIVTPEEVARIGEAPASAVMYRGRIGAIVLAPSGWLASSNILNGERRLPVDALCYFHASNCTVDEAFHRRAIGWCFIEDNPSGLSDQLENTLAIQLGQALNFDPNSTIKSWHESVGVTNSEVLFRRIDYKTAGYVDFTFFADMGDPGLFWACMLSLPSDEEHALNRLRFIADSVVLAFSPTADPNNSHEVWQNFFPWTKEQK